ncbi:MAG: aromatic hydrocarbon degradation protein, partial [Muribaculaceae bacterium]
ETPGMTKIEPSVGFSFRPLNVFSIDVAMLYVAGMGRDNAKCNYEDLLMKSAQMPYVKTFEANYRLHAFCPSIGASFWF